MISAKDILSLLEEWVSVPGGDPNFKIEVLVDPLTWQEVASDFRRDWRDMQKQLFLDPRTPYMLRFAYHPKSEVIKAWMAYHANHDNILGKGSDFKWWCGEVNVDKRMADIAFKRQFETNLQNLPSKLQKFLTGLALVGYNLC